MKRYLTVTLMVGLAVVFSSGFQAKKKIPPASTVRQPQVAWVRAAIGSSEMTAEFPGKPTKMPLALPGDVRARYDVLETVAFVVKEDYTEVGSYAVTKSQAAISLDTVARGALDNVKGGALENAKGRAAAPDYKESITTTTVVGLPGRKIQCSFTNGDKKVFLLGVIFTDRTRMWQVIFTGQVNPKNTFLSSHAIASVKRSPQGAG